MSRFDAATLTEWLNFLESLHPSTIDMGRTRIEAVRDVMQLAPSVPVITVAGTNGKGSVCAMLSSILHAAGFKVGTYTSPHLLDYNERVRINMHPVDDTVLVDAFRAVEAARGETSLTYFEFGTLAAVKCLLDAKVDVLVLEIGLGGRLDAVNIFEPDVAAVVSVGLDHEAYLGDTREAIGFEKAGVYRTGKPALCADLQPPQTLLDHAAAIGAELILVGRDYGFEKQAEGNQWSWWGRDGLHRHALPFPALRGPYQLGNAALVLAILDAIKGKLPVGIGAIKEGLLEVEWPARFQVLPGRPTVILDVGHNPHAAQVLRGALDQMGFYAKTHAVLGMMADKDVAGVVSLLADRIDVWHLAAPQLPRAMSVDELARIVAGLAPGACIERYDRVENAYAGACEAAGEADRILAFGSFFTVAEVLAARGSGL